MTTDANDLVSRFYDAWNREGPEVLRRFASEDIVLRDAPELPDSGTWRGREAVLRRLEEVAAAVGGGWVEVHEVRQFGDRVLVGMDWKIDDGAQGASVGSVFHVAEVDQGEIVAIEVFMDREAAVQAASGAADQAG